MGTFSFWHFLGKLEADLWYVFIWKDTFSFPPHFSNFCMKIVPLYFAKEAGCSASWAMGKRRPGPMTVLA